MLPPLVLTETTFAPLASSLSAINLAASVVALAVLWTRRRSVLDRWLMVALVAAVAEASLIAFVAATRYTVGFYAGRLFALVVSSSVLAAMLWETAQLYMRLSAAVRALQRERANKLMNLEVVVASVAHEIKQPLTVIATRSGVLQRLLKRPQPDLEAAQRNLAEMERASFGIAEVFESIRALFRNPTTGRLCVCACAGRAWASGDAINKVRKSRRLLEGFVTAKSACGVTKLAILRDRVRYRRSVLPELEEDKKMITMSRCDR
jgi:signal transduction histidine kinase